MDLLSFDAEQLIASLALSPNHSHSSRDGHSSHETNEIPLQRNGNIKPGKLDHESGNKFPWNSDTEKEVTTVGGIKKDSTKSEEDFGVVAPSPHDHIHTGIETNGERGQTQRTGDASRSYHAHVLHQLALAATPRHGGIVKSQSFSTAGPGVTQTELSSPHHPLSHLVDDDPLAFELQPEDYTITDEDTQRIPSATTTSLPLAHRDEEDALGRHYTPGHMIAMLAKEVEEDAVAASASASPPPVTRPLKILASPNSLSSISATGGLGTTPNLLATPLQSANSTQTPSYSANATGTPMSPSAYQLSPNSAREIQELTSNAAFEIALSPLPESETNAPNKQVQPHPPDDSAATVAAALIHRNRIIQELLSTEKFYVASLETLVKYFVTPLKTNASLANPIYPGLTLSHEQVQQLFSNVEMLWTLNKKFCEDLEEVVAVETAAASTDPVAVTLPIPAPVPIPSSNNNARPKSIGALFLSFGPFLKMFSTYVSGHGGATELLQSLEKSMPAFGRFCQQQTQQALGASTATATGAATATSPAGAIPTTVQQGAAGTQAQGQRNMLPSLLIQPIQRVPRYSLLLQELLRKTPSTHSDFPKLSRALSIINHVASHINESVRHAENRQTMLKIQESFGSGVIDLLSPGRWFVRQGFLTKRGRKSDVTYVFLLFSDLLLYASTTPSLLGSGATLKLHQSIPLDSSFSFQDLQDELDECDELHLEVNPLRNTSSNEEPSISTPNPADRTAFLSGAQGIAVPELCSPQEKLPLPPSRQNLIQISSSTRSFIVYAATKEQKQLWLEDLSAVTFQIRLNDMKRKENVELARGRKDGITPASNVDSTGVNRVQEGPSAALLRQRSNSLSIPSSTSLQQQPFQFGRVQPIMVQFKATSCCSCCGKTCTSFSGRRHCQSCGQITCSRCCRTPLVLEWAKKECRVCEKCLVLFKQQKIVVDEERRRNSVDLTHFHTSALNHSHHSPQPPPIPARPLHPTHGISHPQRPHNRPSKTDVLQLVKSHSRNASQESLASLSASPPSGARHTPQRYQVESADANSDEESADYAGVLSPKGRAQMR